MFASLARHASERYRPSGRLAYHFARSKLVRDPVYRSIWERGILGGTGTIVDVGCGGGLMLALLASALEFSPTGNVLAGAPGAIGSQRPRLVGVELRPKASAVARQALGDCARIITTDARGESLPLARAILILDVLSMMPAPDQEVLLQNVVSALEPGGVLFLREANAGAGLGFQAVNLGNRAKAWVQGKSSRDFHFRSAGEWENRFRQLGLAVEAQPMGQGTPFANVLFCATMPR